MNQVTSIPQAIMAGNGLHLQEPEEECRVLSPPIPDPSHSTIEAACGRTSRPLSPAAAAGKDSSVLSQSDFTSGRRYSLLQSRVMTQVVAMFYFAGFVCLNSLMPQYIVHRLTLDGRGLLNSSQSGGSSPCANASNSTHADAIQSQASRQVLYFTLVISVPSLLTCLIAGGYSDTFGRRPLLLLGILSGTIKNLLTSIIIRLELPVWLFYIPSVIDGLSGSWTMLFVMLVSSIADTNPDKKDRTFWVAVLGGAVSSVTAVLLAVNGIVIDQLGFFAASLMSLVAAALAFLFAFFYYPETLPAPAVKQIKALDSVRRIAAYFFLGGSARERLTFWTCLWIFMFSVVPQLILVTIDSLYLLHRPFCWAHSTIGFYNGARMALTFTAGIVILRMFRACCQPEVLAMIGLVFQAAGFVLEAEAKKSWQLVLVPLVSSPCTVSIAVIRAILSSLASSADQGAVNSSVAVVEVVINLVGNTGVLSVYSATLSGPLPGAVYLLMASFSVAAFLLYLIYFRLRRPPRTAYEQLVD